MGETESPDANVPSAEMFWVESLTSRPRTPGEACDLTGPVELPAASFFPSAEDIKSTQRGRKNRYLPERIRVSLFRFVDSRQAKHIKTEA